MKNFSIRQLKSESACAPLIKASSTLEKPCRPRAYGKLLVSGLVLVSLGGCVTSPPVKIERGNESFGRVQTCQMKNNYIHHSEPGSTISFSMKYDATPTGGEGTLLIECVDKGEPLFFKDAKIILLCRGKDDVKQRIMLGRGHSAAEAETPSALSPITRLVYKLTQAELVTILTAEWIELNIERRNGSTFKAVLSPENMKNIRIFNNQCILR